MLPQEEVAERRPGRPLLLDPTARPCGGEAASLVKSREGAVPSSPFPREAGDRLAGTGLWPLLVLPSPSTTRPKEKLSQVFENF